MKIARWEKAQKAERNFWQWISNSFGESSLIGDVRDYFSSILGLTDIEFKESHDYLDIGSGPTTIYLALDKGHRVALDPLMNYYLNQFPYLNDLKGIKWITGKIENWKSTKAFNTVFMLNCLNHCENLGRVIEKINCLVVADGYFVMTQHCHTQKWTKNFFTRTSFIFDSCHPNHFIKEDIAPLFEENFELVKQVNIDHLDIERIKSTNKSIKPKTLANKIVGYFKQPDRFTRYVYRMVEYFYRDKLAGKPSQSNFLFIFKKCSK